MKIQIDFEKKLVWVFSDYPYFKKRVKPVLAGAYKVLVFNTYVNK